MVGKFGKNPAGKKLDMSNIEQNLLEEYKIASENSRHFNDLLMRLRMLGLPSTMTIIGAGTVLLGSKLYIALPTGWVNSVGLFFGCALAAAMIGLFFRRDWKPDHQFPIPLYKLERATWALIFGTILLFFGWALIRDCSTIGFNTEKIYPIGAFVMLVGLGLMASLYALDRFYYYPLLVGAVTRATELEHTLSFHLAERTSESIRQPNATRLITWFYAVPGYVGLLATLVIFRLG